MENEEQDEPDGVDSRFFIFYSRVQATKAPEQPQSSFGRRFLEMVDPRRDLHRAELRAAHRAELGALEVVGRQVLVVVLARGLRIEREGELLVPVERDPRAGDLVVALPGARTVTGDVRRV